MLATVPDDLLFMIPIAGGILLSGVALFVSMRLFLKRQERFVRCWLGATLASLAGVAAGAAGIFSIDNLSDIQEAGVWLAAFSLASWLAIQLMFKLPKRKTILTWLPMGIVQAAMCPVVIIAMHATADHRSPIQSTTSSYNLRSLGVSLEIYKQDYRGCYPPDFKPLIEGFYMDPDALEILHLPGKPNARYIYCPPHPNAPESTIVACEPQPILPDTIQALRKDCEVQQLTMAEFQKLLAKPENKAFAEAWRKAQEAAAANAVVTPAQPKGAL